MRTPVPTYTFSADHRRTGLTALNPPSFSSHVDRQISKFQLMSANQISSLAAAMKVAERHKKAHRLARLLLSPNNLSAPLPEVQVDYSQS